MWSGDKNRTFWEITPVKDHKLLKIMQTVPDNVKCISPKIQDVIINEMVSVETDIVFEDVKSCGPGMFGLLADGLRKCRKWTAIESVLLSVRYVRNGLRVSIKMRFTDELNPQPLSKLLKMLTNSAIEDSQFLTQCYVGAIAVSGDKGGAAYKV